MKKFLLSALAAGLTLGAGAEVFTVDGINYSLMADGSGAQVAEGDYTGQITIPATVKNGGVTYKVVGVAKYAFQGSEATAVTLPGTVYSIGDLAFNASDIVTLNIGDGVETIGDGAFSVMRELKNFSGIPATCVQMKGAFMMNDSLKAINVSEDNPVFKSVDGVVFTKSGKTLVAYPNGHGLKYEIPEGVDSIEADCFNTNTALEYIKFPSTLKYVGLGAFTYCRSMETNDLPEGLLSIGANGFSNCRLMSTEMPTTITYLGNMAFNNCWKLKSAYIRNDLELWGGQTFYTTNASNTALTSLTIEPNPKYVTEVPSYAFQSCSKLTEVIVPEGYTKIGGYAFSACTGVKYVDLPSTLTTIDVAAFSNVDADSIVCRATTPPEYTNQMYYLFSNKRLDTVPVYVPDESVDAYKEAWMWSFFKNIQPMSKLSGVKDVNVAEKAVAARVYFNLQGMQVAEPQQGSLYIVKTVYDDGSVDTAKVLQK